MIGIRIWAAIAVGMALLPPPAEAKEPAPALPYSSRVLLKTQETVLGQPIVYPEGPAEVTAMIVTLRPGEIGKLHLHEAPLFGYVMEGVLTVDYGARGSKTFEAGDSLVEALNHPHRGENRTDAPVRIFVVSIGAVGVAGTKLVE